MRAKLTSRVARSLGPRAGAYDCRDTHLVGFLLRVEPSGHKSWFLQYRTREGRQTRTKLGSWPGLSAEGARMLALQQSAEAAQGVDLVRAKRLARSEHAKAAGKTLGVFIDQHYEPWARGHLRSAEFQLARLRSDFRSWLDRSMEDLHAFAAEGIRLTWRREGKQPSTINRNVQRLRAVLSRAVEMGVLNQHPLSGLKPMRVDKTARVRFLDRLEESRLRRALADRETRLSQARIRYNTWRTARGLSPLPCRDGFNLDYVRPLVLLAINSGLRRGELLNLRWRDVNLAARMLTVQASTSKSGRTRRVPLNAEALGLLDNWRQRRPTAHSDQLVFAARDGSRIGRIDKAWRAVTKSANLEDFRFHDCRHHFASRLAQAGVDLYTIKELLGHAEIAMTERYAHLAPENLRAAVERIVM